MEPWIGLIGVVLGGVMSAVFGSARDRTARAARIAELRREVYTHFLIAAQAACDEAGDGPDFLQVLLSRSAEADHLEAARFVVLRHELQLVASERVLVAADALKAHLEKDMPEAYAMSSAPDLEVQQAATERAAELLEDLGRSMALDVQGPLGRR